MDVSSQQRLMIGYELEIFDLGMSLTEILKPTVSHLPMTINSKVLQKKSAKPELDLTDKTHKG